MPQNSQNDASIPITLFLGDSARHDFLGTRPAQVGGVQAYVFYTYDCYQARLRFSRLVQQQGLDGRVSAGEGRGLEQRLAQGVELEDLNTLFPSVLHFSCIITPWNSFLQVPISVTMTSGHLSMSRAHQLRVSLNSIRSFRTDPISMANHYHQSINCCRQTSRTPQAPERMISTLKMATKLSSVKPPITLPQDQSPNMRPCKELHTLHCGGRLRVPQPTTLHLDLAGRASHALHLASEARRISRVEAILAAFKGASAPTKEVLRTYLWGDRSTKYYRSI